MRRLDLEVRYLLSKRFLPIIFVVATAAGVFAQKPVVESRSANVNGVTIHYLKAGTGKTLLVLIHGFGDTSHMWTPLFAEFAKNYTIIAPDLRGIGDSSKPKTGYSKKTAAVDIHELVKSLGYEKVALVGHDIGLMVAYAYAAQFPEGVGKLALLEAPIPGIGEVWNQIYNDPRLWHFHFVDSAFSLPLVKGRERIFLDHFWEEMTTNPKAISEADRAIYTKAYAQEGSMAAAFEYFKAFDREDAADNRVFAANKLPMPVLTIAGDKSMGPVLEIQAKQVANDVTSVIFPNTGHWLIDERPAELKAELGRFFGN